MVTALEVVGEFRPGAHAAEVHDPLESGGVGGVAEIGGGAGVGLGEVVAGAHRVDEVVRGRAAVERPAE